MKRSCARARPSKLRPRKPRPRKEPILLINPRARLTPFQRWAVSAIAEGV